MRKAILTILFLLFTANCWGALHYVRNDGGDSSTCNGHYDASAASTPNCAWRSIATALPNSGVLISAGDTIIIDNIDRDVGSGQAEYEVSYNGVDVVHDGTCFPQNARWCVLGIVPSGIDENNKTKIYGKGWESCDSTNPEDKAQIWGDMAADHLFRTGSNVDIRCLELTDHDVCADNGSYDGTTDFGCDRECSPDGVCDSSLYGIFLSSVDNVYLENLDIHGMSIYGIKALNIGDLELNNVNIIANGWGGLDGTNSDGQTTYYTGTVTLDSTNISWNGCVEDYPLTTQDLTTSTDKRTCMSQDQGHDADAIGMGDGTSGSWIITNSKMNNNTSDGFDMLHSPGQSDTITIKRSEFIGNGGNPVKTNHITTLVENSIISANCRFFDGQTFKGETTELTSQSTCEKPPSESGWGGTWNSGNGTCEVSFNHCRSGGQAFAAGQLAGADYKVYGTTIYGEGDVLIMPFGAGCDGTNTFELKNSTIYGAEEDVPGELPDPWYCANDVCCSGENAITLDSQYNIFYNGKGDECHEGEGVICGEDPGLTDGDIRISTDGVNPAFTITDAGASYANADENVALTEDVDRNNFARGASWDIGAYEFGSIATGATCSTSPSACSVIDGGTECLAAGWYWWSVTSTCQSTEQPACYTNCTSCAEQSTCDSNPYLTCYYYQGSCGVTDPCDISCAECGGETACGGSSQTCNWIPTSGTDHTQDVNAMGAWMMTASSGNETDLSGEGGTLAESGSPNSIPGTSDSPPTSASSRIFESSDTESLAHADGNSTDINGADQPISISVWAKPSSLSGEPTIVSKMGSGSYQYGLWFVNRGVGWGAEFFIANGYPTTYGIGKSAVSTVSVGEWIHVVGVYDDTDIRIYLNGQLSGDPVAYTSGIVNGTGTFNVGARGYATQYFDGNISEVAVFDKALSAAEALDLYTNGLQGEGQECSDAEVSVTTSQAWSGQCGFNGGITFK